MGLHKLTRNLYRWSEEHGESGSRYPWFSYALRLASGAILLVDPLPAWGNTVGDLESLGQPTHILLTCNWHTRAARALREIWGCRILLNKSGITDAEIEVDETFQPPCRLWDSIDLIPMAGLSWPEEVAVYFNHYLLIMDALVGGRADLKIPEGETGIHPNRFTMRHVSDCERARGVILHLADLPLDELHFGHGAPVRHSPAAALRKLAIRLQ
jgi:hypothetical protein